MKNNSIANIVIAIDGPAGAGKSTVAKKVAEKLQVEYVDSGAFYRAITKKILDSNLKIEDYSAIDDLLAEIRLKLENGKIFINNIDFTPYLRTQAVTENVSPVSNNINIRKKVNYYLNEYSQNKSIIMDGRDIGTVVFPDADYKFYVDASLEVRAKRRFDEKNYQTTMKMIMDNIRKRDENDKSKPYGALIQAQDAIYIDTSNLTIDSVVEKIITAIQSNT
ncbi:MAG: (d)CMP kinase [Spirochaetes bacterium]|nr:(d)CMP kinase [Spirochaetota bacterium]